MHPCDHLTHCLAQLLDFPAVLLVQRGVRLDHLGQAFIKLLVVFAVLLGQGVDVLYHGRLQFGDRLLR